MKKSLVWIVLLALVFAFNACKDDPDPVPAIVGTWTLAKYKMTDLPQGFVSYEDYEDTQIHFFDLGYTIVFNQDGTYTRAFTTGSGYPSLNDKGKWTLDGTALKLSPDDPDDLDLIESYETPGIEFSVEGDITDIRMTLNRSTNLMLLPDDFDTTTQPTQDDFKPVDFTLHYVFNKLTK